MERHLAAILAADVVGYSRLMGADEAGTLARLMAHRNEFLDPTIAAHRGRIVKLMGDGVLVEFASVVDALACAVAIQQGMGGRNQDQPAPQRIEFRIGINLGDVIVEGEDIYGDGVNVAARLEGLAEPGGICISDSVRTAVGSKLPLEYEFLGEQQVKNMAEPVRTYRARLQTGAELPALAEARPRQASRSRLTIGAAIAIAIVVLGGGLLAWLKLGAPEFEPAAVEQMTYPLPDKPSIAVLPFDNLSGDRDQGFVADGMTETIISTLSRTPELFVIARNSSFTYKGKPIKVQQVAEELGVRYVLEGSVQRAGEKVRITVQLIDAVKGHHLWSESYDRKFDDLFELQDEIALKTAIALQANLTTGEEARMLSRTTQNIRAWTLYQQALSNFFKFSEEGNREARIFAERALAKDHEFADAVIMVGFTHLVDARSGYSSSPQDSLRLAIDNANKARSLAPDAPNLYNLMQSIYRYQGEFDKAVEAGERAIELSPNSAISLLATAMTTHLAGQFDRSIDLAKMAIRQNPHHRSTGFIWLGRSLWFKGEYAKTIDAANDGLGRAESPAVAAGHLLNLAIARVETGEMDEARQAVSDALQKTPQLSLSFLKSGFGYKKESDWQRIATVLRTAGLPEKLAAELPVKPSIAVLPFTNMSGDPEQEYFADGMTDDLITDLSKVSGLLVIARNSTFTYKGQSPDVRQVAKDLGVRYVIEGSVRRAGDKVRINAQLIDATSGGHMWAERFDGSMADVFSLQDNVNERIVSALAVSLTPADRKRLAGPRTANPDAYDMLLRGLEFYQRFNREDNLRARGFFEKAAALDDGYARAHANIGLTYATEVNMNWTDRRKESVQWGLDHAARAFALNQNIPQIYLTRTMVHLAQRKHEDAMEAAGKLVKLHPNYADGHAALAFVSIYAGELERGLEAIDRAKMLNPRYSYIYVSIEGHLNFLEGRYEKAVALYEEALERNPAFDRGLLIFAAALAHMGNTEDAAWAITEALSVRPDLTLGDERRDSNYRRSEDLERYIEGLRKAGLPE